MTKENNPNHDLNKDPITGEPGCHPAGSGLGAVAGGAAAGAAGGALGGPIGAAIGAVVGGVAGGLAGKAIAEEIDPTAEEQYWSNEYENRDYYDNDADYRQDYLPAYRYGWESRSKYADKSWDQVESQLEKDWKAKRDNSRLEWDRARHVSRDAWDRLSQTECCDDNNPCS